MVNVSRSFDTGQDFVPAQPRELNVLALFKGDQREIFVYDDHRGSILALLRTFRELVLSPESTLNGNDAVVLADRVHDGLKREGKLGIFDQES